jgi:hypothetical protein
MSSKVEIVKIEAGNGNGGINRYRVWHFVSSDSQWTCCGTKLHWFDFGASLARVYAVKTYDVTDRMCQSRGCLSAQKKQR